MDLSNLGSSNSNHGKAPSSAVEDRSDARPGRPQRIFDVLLAASLAFALMRRATDVYAEAAGSMWCATTQGTFLALGLLVCWLILRRDPETGPSPLGSQVAAVPGVLLGAVVAGRIPPEAHGPMSTTLVILGGTLVAWSLATLDKSFAVLPARRATVVSGPYRHLRHPAYAGDVVILAGCALAAPTPLTVILVLASPFVLGLRIRCEETLLARCPHYRAYQRRTPYRLLPFLY